jgi:transcriptional regulator with XRE-family HTH domain
MGRSREELIGDLPPGRRARIEARTAELAEGVEGLRALRRLAGRSQEQLAQSLGIKQPSVHKIERQADLYLSTLRRFVEAAGGSLELRVELPGKGVVRLKGIGEIGEEEAA